MCITTYLATARRHIATLGRWAALVLLLTSGGLGTSAGSVRAAATDAVPPGRSAPAADTTRPIVRTVRVDGNTYFADRRLKRQIRTRPNRRVLSIPGFTWWRWIYQLGSTDWMWDRVGNALKSGGEPPAYLDSTTIAGDLERLRLFYDQQGFRDASVEYEVQTPDPDRAIVTFRVAPGMPTYLRRARYEGVDMLSPAQRQEMGRETLLAARLQTLQADTSLTVALRQQRYQKPLLLEERRRLLAYLQNQGYAAVSRDSIRAVLTPVTDTTAGGRVAPSGAPLWDVTFRINPGPLYRFGDVHMSVTGPESAPARRDTLTGVPVDTSGGYRPLVTTEIRDETHLETRLLRRALQFRPGAPYDRSEVLATKRRLEGAGVFAFTSLSPQYEDVVPGDSATAPYLPLRIEARTRQRHRLRAETFALQRGAEAVGLNEFGVGLSGIYENGNAFGGGEAMQLRLSGSIATGLDTTLISSTQLEATGSVTLPYLIRPFRGFENVFDLTNARTQLSVSGLTAQRRDLRLRIRGRINARLRLEMNHTPSRVSLVDVLDLSLSNPDTLAGFQEQFLNRVFGGADGGGIRDPVQRQQILEDYTRPQVNTALRYTLRDATANPLRRRSGHIYEGDVEVGNTIPVLLDRFVFSPGPPSYTLPGLTGGSNQGLGGRLLYRPYLRSTLDLRRYVPLDLGTTLAFKFLGGVAHPTGGPTVVPFDRRFFSGGANSVRGWRLRELGPGSAGGLIANGNGAAGTDAASLLGGDVKLESSVELRTFLFRDLLTTDWIGAVFLDAGNVWFGPRNQGFGEAARDSLGGTVRRVGGSGRFRGLRSLADIGVGGGFGLRLEWEYVILRFDLAYRLHDPTPRDDDVFGESFGGPLLHFGIGQAF